MAFALMLGCAGKPRRTLFVDIALPAAKSTEASLAQRCTNSDVVKNGRFLLLRGDCGLKLRKKAVLSETKIDHRYCANWFPEQPGIVEGAVENAFLSDSKIEALVDLSFDDEETGGRCLLLKAQAASVPTTF